MVFVIWFSRDWLQVKNSANINRNSEVKILGIFTHLRVGWVKMDTLWGGVVASMSLSLCWCNFNSEFKGGLTCIIREAVNKLPFYTISCELLKERKPRHSSGWWSPPVASKPDISKLPNKKTNQKVQLVCHVCVAPPLRQVTVSFEKMLRLLASKKRASDRPQFELDVTYRTNLKFVSLQNDGWMDELMDERINDWMGLD